MLMTAPELSGNFWQLYAKLTNSSKVCLALSAVGDPFRTCTYAIRYAEVSQFNVTACDSSETLSRVWVVNNTGGRMEVRDRMCRGIWIKTGKLSNKSQLLWERAIATGLFLLQQPSSPRAGNVHWQVLGMVCPNISAVEWIWFNFTRPDTRLPVSADYQSDESRTGSRRNTSVTVTIHLDNPAPIQLPPGISLICGNGYVYLLILIRPKGGPCSLGRIDMIPISLEGIQQIRADKTWRCWRLDQLSKDCNNEVYLYGMA